MFVKEMCVKNVKSADFYIIINVLANAQRVLLQVEQTLYAKDIMKILFSGYIHRKALAMQNAIKLQILIRTAAVGKTAYKKEIVVMIIKKFV